jgi:hypothetical protein
MLLMHLRFKKLFGKRGIVAVLAAVSAVLVCSALPAKANVGTDGFTVLGAYENSFVHKCEVIGVAHKGYEGVVCVDITTGTNSHNYWARGDIEVYCQTVAGVTVKCPAVYEYASFSDGAGDIWYIDDGNCGNDGAGACSSGRNYFYAPAIGYNYANAGNNCADNPGSGWDIWTVAYPSVGVVLPVSGDTEWLPSNFETGHYYACPYVDDGEP